MKKNRYKKTRETVPLTETLFCSLFCENLLISICLDKLRKKIISGTLRTGTRTVPYSRQGGTSSLLPDPGKIYPPAVKEFSLAAWCKIRVVFLSLLIFGDFYHNCFENIALPYYFFTTFSAFLKGK